METGVARTTIASSRGANRFVKEQKSTGPPSDPPVQNFYFSIPVLFFLFAEK